MGRVEFVQGEQRKFLYRILNKRGISLKRLSVIFGYNYSTLKNFYRETRLMPDFLIDKLCEYTYEKREDLHIKKIHSDNWGKVKGGRKGIRTTLQKYDNKLRVWRALGGKTTAERGSRRKLVVVPEPSKELSELIGVILGDGALTKYFLRIFGDPRFDIIYFLYISYLVKRLFGISSSIKTGSDGVLTLTVCSINMCAFLNEEYNLPFGSKIKNKAAISEEIMNNEEYLRACLRGLFDTDGFVGKSGNRLKVVFTSKNPLLAEQVAVSLLKFNIAKNGKVCEYKEISSYDKVIKYFNLIGSANLRHIIRFKEFIENGNLLYKRETLDYYWKYKDVQVPLMGS